MISGVCRVFIPIPRRRSPSTRTLTRTSGATSWFASSRSSLPDGTYLHTEEFPRPHQVQPRRIERRRVRRGRPVGARIWQSVFLCDFDGPRTWNVMVRVRRGERCTNSGRKKALVAARSAPFRRPPSITSQGETPGPLLPEDDRRQRLCQPGAERGARGAPSAGRRPLAGPKARDTPARPRPMGSKETRMLGSRGRMRPPPPPATSVPPLGSSKPTQRRERLRTKGESTAVTTPIRPTPRATSRTRSRKVPRNRAIP